MENNKENGSSSYRKPRLSRAEIWNMSMGFLGIQAGFALQNGNASRILQTFGADVDHLPLFWLAAPLTGMIVQPIIGHYSDRTWNRFGRRKPFFLVGALLTALALLFLPNSAALAQYLPPLLMGGGMLMIMDTSINVAMEPFRALVADKLPESQHSSGFAVQTFLIGVGAVIGSWLPYVLAEYFHVDKIAAAGQIPLNVKYAFYIGAVLLLITIFWTVLTTREYQSERQEPKDGSLELRGIRSFWYDIKHVPKTMRELGWVQFFSWFGLFSMWVFSTPAIAEHIYHVPSGDTGSGQYADAGNWVGILFGIYNGISAIYALVLPKIADKIGRKQVHALSLVVGGLSLISIYFISDPLSLIFPMIGVGIAWGSILSMPYAILSGSLPPGKVGFYMGLFNFFITFPQIINGIFGGGIVKHLYHDQSIYALVMAGVFFIFGALATCRIKGVK